MFHYIYTKYTTLLVDSALSQLIILFQLYMYTIATICTHTHVAGEPFTQEEVEEMMSAALDPDKGVILYRDFVTSMLPEAEQS